MAKSSKKTIGLTKKHQARLERERKQRRYIMVGSLIVLVLVFGIIGYGYLDQAVIQNIRTVASVNGEKIRAKELDAQVRYGRYSLIRSATQYYQYMQYFGGDSSMMGSFVQQLQQIQAQMEKDTIGQTVLDNMIDDAIIRQEAKKRGITVSKQEIDKAIQDAFGYFPEGTPTPSPTYAEKPTSTLSPLQETLTAPTFTPTPTITPTVVITATANITLTVTPTLTYTPTPQATATITPTATSQYTATPLPTNTPLPTETPFTKDGFESLKKTTFETFLKDYKVSENDLRYVFESNLLRRKLSDAIVGEIQNNEDQIWARHILVATDQTARDVITRINNGENFCQLAAELSTDSGTKANCGDLGWFGKNKMVNEFETAAFALEVGQTSQPVQSSYGFHVIQLLGKENRQLTASEYQTARDTKFNEWLTTARASAKIEKKDDWNKTLPVEPTLPSEITDLITQYMSQDASGLPTAPDAQR